MNSIFNVDTLADPTKLGHVSPEQRRAIGHYVALQNLNPEDPRTVKIAGGKLIALGHSYEEVARMPAPADNLERHRLVETVLSTIAGRISPSFAG